jgi:short-subunit dehydrogenase
MQADSTKFVRRFGPWALITGGSEGLGAEFARQAAERGLNVALVARRPEVLQTFREELLGRYSVDVKSIALDLAAPGAVAALCGQVQGLDIGLLVCSAASSPLGDYLEVPAADHSRLVDLNCRVPALLSWELGRRMAARQRGGIILVSSMAGFQGTGFVAHYAASKAYVRVLAEGLWNELRGKGVDVLACCPGLVRTPTLFAGRPVRPSWLASPLMDCAPVVRQTLDALGRRPVVVPGTANRLTSWITQRLLPRRAAILLASRGTRAMYPSRRVRGPIT